MSQDPRTSWPPNSPDPAPALDRAQKLLPSIDTTSKLLSQPFIEIGGYKYAEWNKEGWGPLEHLPGVSYSSDTFFYQLARMVGLDEADLLDGPVRVRQANRHRSAGDATGIVPTQRLSAANVGQPMYDGELVQAGIGQGYDATTPLQLLNAYCALANGGTVWQPQVVKSVTDGATGTVNEIQPVALNHLHAADGTISQQILANLR